MKILRLRIIFPCGRLYQKRLRFPGIAEFKVYSWVFVESEDVKQKYGLVRSFGLLQATALNMSNMVGIGPFITIPMMISSMGGPQCMLGWAVGTILALCDGLMWSELAAAMPGTGGTYLYLRETFRNTRFGVLLPFLFVWQFIFSGPLEIASGYIGFAQYLSYFWRSMGPWHMRLTTVAVAVTVLALLYRRITAVGKLTVVLWIGMLLTVVWIIASGLANFIPLWHSTSRPMHFHFLPALPWAWARQC